MSESTSFIDRMIVELSELETKTTKLNEFIHNKSILNSMKRTVHC